MYMCLSVCLFFSLKPFTSYKFRMLATNDIGDSIISKETEAVTTLQDGERLGSMTECVCVAVHVCVVAAGG